MDRLMTRFVLKKASMVQELILSSLPGKKASIILKQRVISRSKVMVPNDRSDTTSHMWGQVSLVARESDCQVEKVGSFPSLCS